MLEFTLPVVDSMGLERCAGLLFIALKITHLSLPTNSWQPLVNFSYFQRILPFQNVIQLEPYSMQPSQIGFFPSKILI